MNTERAEYLSQGMNHTEGGWPKDINPTENDQTVRFRKKIEKDDSYVSSVLGLCGVRLQTFFRICHLFPMVNRENDHDSNNPLSR